MSGNPAHTSLELLWGQTNLNSSLKSVNSQSCDLIYLLCISLPIIRRTPWEEGPTFSDMSTADSQLLEQGLAHSTLSINEWINEEQKSSKMWFIKALDQWASTCSHDSSHLPAWDIYILKAPKVVCFLHRSPLNFISLLELPADFSWISGWQKPTSSSFWFPLSLIPLRNLPTSFNTSPILSKEYLKDCKVYWTLTTPRLYLLSARDSKTD